MDKSPGIRTLDGSRLKYALLAGTIALEKGRESINSINVFPVPDGDTGDNMAATCRYIVERAEISRSLEGTSASMAEAALEGSRGNSGIILAQYLYGISQALKGHAATGTALFGKSLLEAVPFAEDALQKPVEGTILTVIRDWSREAERISRCTGDFVVLLRGSLEAARRSLRDTPTKLEILAREKVVDAGAQGFVIFLQGICDFIAKGNLRELVKETAPVSAIETGKHGLDSIPAFRYCTEAIIQSDGLTRETLMSDLSAEGDSVLIGGHEGKFRIHLHTNRPEELFEKLSSRGTINGQKADDMLRQIEARSINKPSIALMTDSSCDLPKDLVDRYRIHMMPLMISFEGSSYLDKITIRPERVYSLLNDTETVITTSQPGYADLARTYSFLTSSYDHVIAVHLSSALSGTWNTSLKAASDSMEPGKIHVIDSRNLCSGLGLIVLHAARAIEEGRSHGQVLEIIEGIIPRTRIFVSLGTLKYMVRGGRINPITGRIAGLLNLKPVISVDSEGRGTHYGRPGSEGGNLRRIAATFEKLLERRGITDYAVVHANAPEKAAKLADDLIRRSGAQPAYITGISPLIGIHSGPGSVAVSLVLEK